MLALPFVKDFVTTSGVYQQFFIFATVLYIDDVQTVHHCGGSQTRIKKIPVAVDDFVVLWLRSCVATMVSFLRQDDADLQRSYG